MDRQKFKPLNNWEIVGYLVSFIFIYLLWSYVPSDFFELFTARASSMLLNSFGLQSTYWMDANQVYLTLEGGIRYVNVIIIRECTAIHVLGILVGMIIPLKGKMLQKIKSIFLGGLITLLMNLSRITLIVILSGYYVPPFNWFFQNPTLETYHYSISFIYGIIGIVILILVISKFIMPELGGTLVSIPLAIEKVVKGLSFI